MLVQVGRVGADTSGRRARAKGLPRSVDFLSSEKEGGEGRMKSFVLTLLATFLLADGSQPLVSLPDAPTRCPGQARNAPSASDLEGVPLAATIIQIDQKQGRLELQTELGVLHTIADPEELRGLRAGDNVVACVSGEADEPGSGKEGPDGMSFLYRE
jgi:hypothetical protein